MSGKATEYNSNLPPESIILFPPSTPYIAFWLKCIRKTPLRTAWKSALSTTAIIVPHGCRNGPWENDLAVHGPGAPIFSKS